MSIPNLALNYLYKYAYIDSIYHPTLAQQIEIYNMPFAKNSMISLSVTSIQRLTYHYFLVSFNSEIFPHHAHHEC